MAFSFLKALFGRPATSRLNHLHFVLYTRTGCHLCELAESCLRQEQRRHQFKMDVVNVDEDRELAARYGEDIPVVTVQGKVRFRGKVNSVLLRRLLEAEAAKQAEG